MISLAALVISLLNIVLVFRRTSQDDELSLTARIARAKVVEGEMERVSTAVLRNDDSRALVKNVAREVFMDEMTLMFNRDEIVDGKVYARDQKAVASEIDRLHGSLGKVDVMFEQILAEIRKTK